MASSDGPSPEWLQDPEFHGVPAHGEWREPPKPWPWDPIIDKVRARPHQEAIVARYEVRQGVTRFDTLAQRRRDSSELRRGLRRRYPLERWVVREKMQPGTWYTRLLTAEFKGYLTEDERERMDAETREAGLVWKARVAENKLARGLTDHARAVAAGEERRARALGIPLPETPET